MAEPESSSNVAEFTVSELSFALKRTVEDAYGYVRVRGEISGYRGPHSSGHAYFALKDEGAKIDAVVWRGVFQRLRFKPEEGMEVVASGKMTTYPGKSAYQIVVDALEPAGAGALMALLEERRKRLAAEGLFDAARKQLLPDYPRVVGVVTSPAGAVIRDILHRLADRFPVHVLVWPVRVQGETSAAEIAAAIRGFDALPADGPIPRPDVVIVARGGGSLEDLWSFNEEIVVRAAAASSIPIVSAVGHETDTTLIDFAADVRAPTPTAAAELVVPVRADLLDRVATLSLRLRRAALRGLEANRAAFLAAVRGLPRAEAVLALPRQRLDTAAARLPRALSGLLAARRLAFATPAARLTPAGLSARLERGRTLVATLSERERRALVRILERRRDRLAPAAQRLDPGLVLRALERRREMLDARAKHLASLSYRAVLARGYALVRGQDGTALRSAAAVAPGTRLDIEFADGRIGATAEGVRSRTAPRKPAPGQDDLFGG